jgi:hypothetical protein
MNDSALYNEWYQGLIIAGIIIVAAALLLILVWQAARRIRRLAQVALQLVKQIKDNTQGVWDLQETNQVASSILEGAEQIKEHAVLVAEALKEETK